MLVCTLRGGMDEEEEEGVLVAITEKKKILVS